MRQATLRKVIMVKKRLRDLAASKLNLAEQEYVSAQTQSQEIQSVIDVLRGSPVNQLNDFFLREEEQHRAQRALEQSKKQEALQRDARDKQKKSLQECARSLATSETAYEIFLEERATRQKKNEQLANDESRRESPCESL
jgi:uncharacterized protein YeeX (DUF496 family)